MWALSTCGEPNETKKNTHPKNVTALFREQGSAKQDDGQVKGMSMSFANPTYERKQPTGADVDDGELYVESEGAQHNYDEIAQGTAQQPSYEGIAGEQRAGAVANTTYQGFPDAVAATPAATQAVEETGLYGADCKVGAAGAASKAGQAAHYDSPDQAGQVYDLGSQEPGQTYDLGAPDGAPDAGKGVTRYDYDNEMSEEEI